MAAMARRVSCLVANRRLLHFCFIAPVTARAVQARTASEFRLALASDPVMVAAIEAVWVAADDPNIPKADLAAVKIPDLAVGRYAHVRV